MQIRKEEKLLMHKKQFRWNDHPCEKMIKEGEGKFLKMQKELEVEIEEAEEV